jgi:mRNA-degrading endonuclease toxin of MazEF toxin-antitoxin module
MGIGSFSWGERVCHSRWGQEPNRPALVTQPDQNNQRLANTIVAIASAAKNLT